jgi:hypothetical protein
MEEVRHYNVWKSKTKSHLSCHLTLCKQLAPASVRFLLGSYLLPT